MSANKSVYLDWAATAIPEKEILLSSLAEAVQTFGNPSSAHAYGKEAQAALEGARKRLSAKLGFRKGYLAFTGSGTEADQIPLLALLSKKALAADKPRRIVISAIEHAAVSNQAKVLEKLGFRVARVAPDEDGILRVEKILGAVDETTLLVAVMWVNNETGAIQPIGEIAEGLAALASHNGKSPRFHVDGVQALGKLALDWPRAPVSTVSFSAHKIGGPKGLGALWIDTSTPLDPLACGGGQENGIRSGTENVFGALSFSRCAEKYAEDLPRRVAAARHLEEKLLVGTKAIPGAQVLPQSRFPGDPRFSPFIINLAFPGLGGEVMARALAERGIAVSTGSACSTRHSEKTRRVLDAMGVPPQIALSSIRVSTGSTTTPEEVDIFLETAARLYSSLKT